jgi:hypothetical protein
LELGFHQYLPRMASKLSLPDLNPPQPPEKPGLQGCTMVPSPVFIQPDNLYLLALGPVPLEVTMDRVNLHHCLVYFLFVHLNFELSIFFIPSLCCLI